MLCLQKGKTGEPTIPRENQKLHYKRKGWVAKKGRRKKRETQKKKRFSRKTISKIGGEERNTKGKTNIASRYPVKAIIAHTRIQRESNFASFEG